VVKIQPIDIVDVILWLVLRPRVVYQREIGSVLKVEMAILDKQSKGISIDE